MKVLITILGFALLAQLATAYPGNQIDLPKSCTDILSADTCKKIEDFALKLKLDATEVLAIIQKVANEGVTDAKELYAKVVTYLGELSCAKALGADTCKKLADYAAKLKLNADELMVVIKKAVDSGITDARELYTKIVQYMSELTCVKVLGADTCKTIAEYAAKLKLTAEELMVVVKKALDSGITDAKEIGKEIVKYMGELTCEKVLGTDFCNRLQKLADLLSLNFDKVVLKLTEYYEKGISTAKELFWKLIDYIKKGSILGDEAEIEYLEKRGIIDLYKLLKEKIKKFLDELRNLPEMTTEILKKIQAKIDELMKSGRMLKIAQYISNLVDKYFPEFQSDAVPMELDSKDYTSNDMPMEISLKNFTCSDALQKLLSVEFCKNLEDMAAKLQLTYDEVLNIIKNAKNVVGDVKKMYAEIVKYMNELSCSKIIGADKCNLLKKFADLVSLNFNKIVLKLKEFYESGVTALTDLYKKVLKWITGIFGDELENEFMANQGIIGFNDSLVEKLNAVLEKLKKLPGMTAEVIKKIQVKIQEFIKSAKFQAVAKYIKDLFEQYFPQSNDMHMEISLTFKDFKCSIALQQLLSVEFCKNLEDMAAKLQLTYEEVLDIIKNVKDVVSDTKKMYEEIVKYMNELSCSKIIGADKCNLLKNVADLISLNFNNVVLKLKEFYESGVTDVTDLYNKVISWLTGIFGDELEAEFMENQGIIGFNGSLMEKLNAFLEKLKKLPGMNAEIIRQMQVKIQEFIKSGKFQDFAKYIKDLLEKYFPQ